jgi:hypothetical protein
VCLLVFIMLGWCCLTDDSVKYCLYILRLCYLLSVFDYFCQFSIYHHRYVFFSQSFVNDCCYSISFHSHSLCKYLYCLVPTLITSNEDIVPRQATDQPRRER